MSRLLKPKQIIPSVINSQVLATSGGTTTWLSLSAITTDNTVWTAGTGTNSAVLADSGSVATGTTSVAEGATTKAYGIASHAEGRDTIASGEVSHAEGDTTTASGYGSHAEGALTIASGAEAHAEGFSTTASSSYTHAEGRDTLADAVYAHAEGNLTVSNGIASHAEGQSTTASGNKSHSEGGNTLASGESSHAGGQGQSNVNRITASGQTSFAHFRQTASTGYIGAYGDNSAILGGVDHNIGTGSTNSAILGGDGNIISDDILRSVVLGGLDITGTTSDTVYVPKLNVGTLNGTASVVGLGLDANNMVVSASTGGGISTYAETIPSPGTTATTITHNLGTTNIIVSLWLATADELTTAKVNNRQTNSVDITFSVAPGEDIDVVIQG